MRMTIKEFLERRDSPPKVEIQDGPFSAFTLREIAANRERLKAACLKKRGITYRPRRDR